MSKEKSGKNRTNKEIKQKLESLAEPEFQRFAAALIPNISADTIIGVRLLHLRKIAKQIARSDWKHYLENAVDDSFEEVMLQGMVIGCLKADFSEILHYAKQFIPKINNWSLCDSFCSGLKLAKAYPKEVWNFLVPYLKAEEEYSIRFGVVMLLFYYAEEEYREEAFGFLENINSDFYYVKMAVAWAVSIYYIKYPRETMEFLNRGTLEPFTYQKALQKIIESKKIDKETKDNIRAMKKAHKLDTA